MREPTSTRVFIADRRSVLLSEGVAGARARGATLGPCLRWLTLCLLAGVSVCDPPAPSWAPEAPTDNGTCHASKLRRLRAPRRQTVNGACADADVLPGVYTSDMVLQGGPDVCLSGGGPAEGLVAVAAPDGALAAADDCAVCPAGAARAAGGPGAEGGAVCGRVEAQGRCGWRACFGALPVGPAPLTLRVCPRAAPPRTLTNVLVGDVYLCAGQSNMAFALAAELAQRHILRPPELHAPYAPDAAAPAGADPGPAPAAADYVTDDPLVRYRNARDPFVPFWFAGDRNVTRRRNRGDVWTWRPVLDFSSACYHFARALRRRQPRRPVGLLQFAVGGAPIAAFLTAFSRSLCPSPQGVPTASVDGGAAARRAARAPVHIDTPKAGSLVPDFWGLVQHVRVAAVLWYQGEAEVMANKRYLTAMQVLFHQLRLHLGKALPIVLTLLSSVGPRTAHGTVPLIRQSQIDVLRVAGAPMALAAAHDLGRRRVDGPDNEQAIHPPFKRELGERLALTVHALVHGARVPWRGPRVRDIAVQRHRARHVLRLTFADATGGGLHFVGRCDAAAAPFQYRAAGRWRAAPAFGLDDGGRALLVHTGLGAAAPTALRFDFEDQPQCFVHNAARQPLLPFQAPLPCAGCLPDPWAAPGPPLDCLVCAPGALHKSYERAEHGAP